MNRRLLLLAATALSLGVGSMAVGQSLPPLEKKERYKVGFAQMESNNPWRIAETKSFHDTAENCNWDLIATDAAGSAAKQVADVDSMIAQGIDVSESMQMAIWDNVLEIIKFSDNPMKRTLVVAANEVIDIHTERVNAAFQRLPIVSLFLLLFIFYLSLIYVYPRVL